MKGEDLREEGEVLEVKLEFCRDHGNGDHGAWRTGDISVSSLLQLYNSL